MLEIMEKNSKKVTAKHIALIFVGVLSLVLGGIGIILPLLPTTPFALLAAGCFSVANPRMARKLEESKLFGSYLRHWRTHEGVPVKTKVRAIIWLWLGLGISAAIVRTTTVIIILAVVGTIVTLHLILIKTQRKEGQHEILTPKRVDT